VISADPRLLAWIRRVAVALVVGVVAGPFLGWRLGVTAAAVAAVIDTIYSSRTMALIPAEARISSAQRMTRRRLAFARRYGYLAVHSRAIPGTGSVIDHLVVGPSGVVAIDSERWDRRLPVRTVASNSAGGPVLYHGPFSQKQRLAHARWTAVQTARLLSAELGREVPVAPAMVIYGPGIPWKVATLRGVDVFAGGSVGRYLRGRNRESRGRKLGWEQAGEIYDAADRALPPAPRHPVPGPSPLRRRSHRPDS
jgi:Nuclease-related domain